MKFALLLMTLLCFTDVAHAQWTEVKRLVQQADREPKKADSLLNAAHRLAKVSIAKNPNSADEHLWFANATGRLAQSKSGMEKMELAKVVRDHAEKAIKLDPKHAEAHMTLGAWMFYVSDLSFIEKGFLKLIDPGMLKSASYDKAVHHLTQAIVNGVEFQLESYYIRAMAYDELDQEPKARADFQKVISFKARNAKERGFQDEARDWLD
jgi:tetratricopeptide (TPR) repeat protein